MNDELSSSLEDYLETILLILQEKQAVRAKEIASRMGVRNSSVTGALHSLAEKGLLNYSPYDIITLTPEGDRIARDVWKRHLTLRAFFIRVLHVEPTLAEDAACQMEHSISRPILDRLISYLEFIDSCPNAGSAWDSRLGFLCQRNCADLAGPFCQRDHITTPAPLAPPAPPEDDN